LNHVLEGIRLDFGWAARAAVERPAEIVQALLAARLFADERVGVEPKERAFIVEIDTAAAVRPIRARGIQVRRCRRGVLQWPPGPPGLVACPVRDKRPILTRQ